MDTLYTLDSQMSDEQRFRDAVKWNVACYHCEAVAEFTGPVRVVFKYHYHG